MQKPGQPAASVQKMKYGRVEAVGHVGQPAQPLTHMSGSRILSWNTHVPRAGVGGVEARSTATTIRTINTIVPRLPRATFMSCDPHSQTVYPQTQLMVTRRPPNSVQKAPSLKIAMSPDGVLSTSV